MQWFAISPKCPWMMRRAIRRLRDGLVDEWWLRLHWSAVVRAQMEKSGIIRYAGDSPTPPEQEPKAPDQEPITRKRGRPPKTVKMAQPATQGGSRT